MKVFGLKVVALIGAIFNFAKEFLFLIGRALADILIRLLDIILPLTKIAVFIKRRMPPVWAWLTGIGIVKRTISRNVFRKFGSAAPARPHAQSMASSYTSWKSLTDRTYTGRHLPENTSDKSLPAFNDIVDLFMRDAPGTSSNSQTDCIRSTVMFAAFAQWFTDSFLRTAHSFKFDDEGNVIRDASGAPEREPGREKRNTSNHEIDLCQIYGLNEHQTNILRLRDDPENKGCLKFQMGEDGEYPEFLLNKNPFKPDKPCELSIRKPFVKLHPDERILRSIFLRADHNKNGYQTIFATGLEHSNATIGNAMLNTIFLREHNRVARAISADNSDWDDDQVFETARNVMIVLLLKIVISDYIRHISPLDLPLEFQPEFAEKTDWYRTNRISIEFNLLYRWHSLVPDEFEFLPDPSDPHSFRHNNDWLMKTGIAKAVSEFSNQNAGKIVIGNTPLYLKGVKKDTVRIMRDSKLAPYNDYRKRFNLPEAETFNDITQNTALASKLAELYDNDISKLEWYVGLFAEDHGPDMIMGDFLTTMVAHDAFTQALTNPLLSKEVLSATDTNLNEKSFSRVGWEVIKNTSKLSDIVQRVSNVYGPVNCSFSQ